MGFYEVPDDGCNFEIMGYKFFAEEVSPTESLRRRELNSNSIVGGTKKTTKGEYVGLEFSVTTHVKVDPKTPNMYNNIFQEMMRKPVKVTSPEIGGSFNANVIIKPERETAHYLKLTISIKEVVDGKSKIPGESFTVPATKKITVKKKKTKTSTKSNKKNKSKTKNKTIAKKVKSAAAKAAKELSQSI